MIKFNLLVLTTLFSLVCNAGLIGTVWEQKSELIIDGKLLCSYDAKKPATYIETGGYVKIDKWQEGWFRIEANYGCALGWFGSHSLVFRQMGSNVFDKNGLKVGTISDSEIKITSGTDWSGELKIQNLNVLLSTDGHAKIDSKFTHKNSYGYKVFEFRGNLAPVSN